jgi:hypothetical protein
MTVDYGSFSDSDPTVHYSDHFDYYTRVSSTIVRKALFPEFALDDEVNGDAYHTSAGPSSLVHLLAEPAQSFKESIIDLINFCDDVEEASNNIPELIRLLSDKDPHVVSRAARMVYLLSKEDKCIATLASNEHLVGALVNATNSQNAETQRDAVAVLSHISNHADGRMYIFRSGGIEQLVKMLRSPVESVVHYAVTTLHNLLIYLETAKEDIVACGGLEALVPLLDSPNPKLQALVADSIYFLLLDRPQCKQSFLSLQGPRFLVKILESDMPYLKLIYAVVRCIRSISTDPQNKASLISLGCLEALHVNMTRIYDPKRKLAVLNAMRNLSDVATNLETLGALVVDLVLLIEESVDEEIVSCACGILSNLTCNNTLNKQAVCSNGGISILTRALTRFPNIEDITEPALCTMRHCTARHTLAQQAQNDLRINYAHPVILSLLATRRPPIVKAALGLVRNCALSQVNLQSLISEKTAANDTVVSITVEILIQSGSLLMHNFDGLTEGVSLLEMVEGAISALHQLAKDPLIAQIIFNNPDIMNILVDLMSRSEISNNEDELMMREIVGLIYQLTKTPEGAQTVKMYGPVPHIVDALGSPHKSIAAYASIILKNMGVEKPDGYRRASNDGTGAHRPHPNGEMGWMNDGMEPELYNELYSYTSIGEMNHVENSEANESWFDTDL